jgi:electron transfer flavoprotein beta subunit
MKILVCVKQVPDSEGIITIDDAGTWIRFEGTCRMNRFDEFALEEALRIREKINVETIDALSVGRREVSSTIRKALEMGASGGIHIVTEDEGYLSPFDVASLIASFAGDRGYDLILTGVMAEDDMQSQVGQMTAEMLGYPCASSVIYEEIQPGKGSLYAEREIAAGERECLEMTLPAVLTIQSGINRPRYPSLSNVMRARTQKIETIKAFSVKGLEKREKIIALRKPEVISKGVFLKGEQQEKARTLLKILHEKSIL